MEATAAAAASFSVSVTRPRWPLRFPSLPSSSFLPPTALVSASSSNHSICFKSSHVKQLLRAATPRRRDRTAVRSSSSESSSPGSSERWLLAPVGDGDWRHIGYKVPLPDAFEIVSDAVNVGRLPDKADMVIPVATVSGLHARIEKRKGTLLITDLDSTNGTFIDDKRLKPGAVTAVPPGSRLIFGDDHLAMFLVSKIEEEDIINVADDIETNPVVNVASENLETAS